ncbi:DUF6037 family protein [Gluconobacter vitians]|uniref:DUF6037 family protein n=1 Tax=Gluconobacter vitians TaxID=2728102 RepID=UPI0038994665
MNELRPLLNSMVNQGIQRCVFPYERNGVRFSVVFTRESGENDRPLALLFGATGANPFAFIFYGALNLEFNTLIDREEYIRLRNYLGLNYDPARPFSTSAFLRNFADSGQIPNGANPLVVPEPHQVPAPARFVSDAERPYFHGWRQLSAGYQVSDRNYRRTLFSFGLACAEYCKKQHISSCWTAVERDAQRAVAPGGFPG